MDKVTFCAFTDSHYSGGKICRTMEMSFVNLHIGTMVKLRMRYEYHVMDSDETWDAGLVNAYGKLVGESVKQVRIEAFDAMSYRATSKGCQTFVRIWCRESLSIRLGVGESVVTIGFPSLSV